jgi:hypothetical protein
VLAFHVRLIVRQQHVFVTREQRIDEGWKSLRSPSETDPKLMRSSASRSLGFDS